MQLCNATNIKSNQFSSNEFQIKSCVSIAIQNLILEIMKFKLSSTVKEVKNQNQNQSQNQNLSENFTGNFIKNV